jgi:AcrR family transcriptional regulator
MSISNKLGDSVTKEPKVNESDFESLWAKHSDGATLGVREKLIILSAYEIRRVGVLEFNAKTPCEAIGANTSIVNYYFGGREGLMAEAAFLVHTDWVNTVVGSLSRRPMDPAKQIRKIFEAELAYYNFWGEMAIFAAYPNSSPALRSTVHEKYQDRLQSDLEFYLAVLAILIHDARAGTRTLIDFDTKSIPKHKMATHSSALLAATSLTWSIHGLGIWAAGQYVASEAIEDHRLSSLTINLAQRHHIKHIIKSAINL